MEQSTVIDINLRIFIPPRRVEAFEILAKSIGWKPEEGVSSFTFVANHLELKMKSLKNSSYDALKKYQGEAGKEEVLALIAEYEQAVKITQRILI